MGWADTKLLLHCNGIDGAVAMVDSSASNHNVVFNGTAQLDTAQKKFGTASLYLPDDTSDFIHMLDSIDWSPRTNNFTLDFQSRIASFSEEFGFCRQFADSSNYFKLSYNVPSEHIVFQAKSGGSPLKADYRWDWVPALNTFYHLALIRNGTDLQCYINGVALPRTIYIAIGTNDLGDITANFEFGYEVDLFYHGWFDEIRFVNGVAEHTGNFVAPVAEYVEPISVEADRSIQEEAWGSVAPMREMPVDALGLVVADRGVHIWSGIDFNSYGICVDALAIVPADRSIPVDSMLRVKPDKSIPVDSFGPTIADRIIPIGVLEYIDNDLTLPVDFLAGIRMDETMPFWAYHDPAEDSVLGLSVLENIRQDREIPVATMLRVNRPVTIPVAVISNLNKDISILTDVLEGIRGERNLHIEASGLLVVDNRIVPVDSLGGISEDASVPVDSRGWTAASFSIPIGVAQLLQQDIEIIAEAKQGLGPDRALPVDAVGQTNNDIELLIQSLTGVAPDRELRTEATGSASADRALITEWLRGVSPDREFRIESLEEIASDAEINLSILQEQAEVAIAADRTLSLSIIQGLRKEAVLPVDALQRLETDVTALLEAMEALVSDNAIPIDAKYGGVVILSRKIRSLLIVDGVYSTLYKRGD